MDRTQAIAAFQQSAPNDPHVRNTIRQIKQGTKGKGIKTTPRGKNPKGKGPKGKGPKGKGPKGESKSKGGAGRLITTPALRSGEKLCKAFNNRRCAEPCNKDPLELHLCNGKIGNNGEACGGTHPSQDCTTCWRTQ